MFYNGPIFCLLQYRKIISINNVGINRYIVLRHATGKTDFAIANPDTND